LPDVGVRCRGDALGGDSVVNDPAVIIDDLGRDDRVFINSYDLVASHGEARQPIIAEIPDRNERVAIGCQPEIETKPDRTAEVGETGPGPEAGGRRQRRPTAIISRIP